MRQTARDQINAQAERLAPFGITWDDAAQLRRIAQVLDRWHVLECGDEHGRAIERDDVTGRPFITFDTGNGKRGRYSTADRERGALRRLDAIMAKYPHVRAYVQGDPRGCPLYILPQDVDDDMYHRGVAVFT